MSTVETIPPQAQPQPRALPRRRRMLSASLPAAGEPMVWLTGGSLLICLLMIIDLLALVLWNGMSTFWPQGLVQVRTLTGKTLLGEVTREETYTPGPDALDELGQAAAQARARLEAQGGQAVRRLLRTGNFDLTNTHFTWIHDFTIDRQDRPEWAMVVERQSWGRFYGALAGFAIDGKEQAQTPAEAWDLFNRHHDEVRRRFQQRRLLETDQIGQVNRALEDARLAVREAELDSGRGSQAWQKAQARFLKVEGWSREEFAHITGQIQQLNAENDRYKLRMRTADGKDATIALADVVRAYPANRLDFWGKLGVYGSRAWEFLSDVPREANSEGGVFPAIFGTVLMTLIMSLAVVPLGVLAALYLREYAKAGPVVSAVRIAVNNLAGVPSIVFGVFGLGFFCYGIGSWIDAGPQTAWPRWVWYGSLGVLGGVLGAALLVGSIAWRRPHPSQGRRSPAWGYLALALWLATVLLAVAMVAKSPFFHGFYRARLPNPTFGKGALIWGSFTLALLTLPVVIVATEEALAAVPNSMREGSYACGGSKWQTIRRIVLPRAMPGILTGTILAMARGAGEVAPLMLVGAVKYVPELPVDSSFPFGANKSFMHLGFHIYDVGFQSQNSEASKPMVFTATLLLIAIIAVLNLAAITLRSRLRKKFVTNQF